MTNANTGRVTFAQFMTLQEKQPRMACSRGGGGGGGGGGGWGGVGGIPYQSDGGDRREF